MICSHYRQWQIPSNLNIIGSILKYSQISRYKIFTNQVSRASSKKFNIIILADDNINSMEDNSLTNNLRNIELKNLKYDMLIQNSLVSHNKDPTFFRNGFRSCINHIITNCPTKITNVFTHINNNYPNDININTNIINNDNSILSDYSLLSCSYNSKDIHIPQQFEIIRDGKLLTKERLLS